MGFEPTVPCSTHAFQACALSHSAISPVDRLVLREPSGRRGGPASQLRFATSPLLPGTEDQNQLAEREGFEPSIGVNRYTLSRGALSASSATSPRARDNIVSGRGCRPSIPRICAIFQRKSRGFSGLGIPSGGLQRRGIRLAEREGFEPSRDVNPCRFSRPVHSTALPPLRTQNSGS